MSHPPCHVLVTALIGLQLCPVISHTSVPTAMQVTFDDHQKVLHNIGYDSGIIIPLKTTIYVYYWTRTNLIISNYITIVFACTFESQFLSILVLPFSTCKTRMYQHMTSYAKNI